MGRQPKEIKWDTVIKRMEAGNNAKQIAFAHEIHLNTFYDRFKKEFGVNFCDYKDEALESGRANIAYVQYAKALSGNVQMLTLLGEEWNGQGTPKVKENEASERLLELEAENSRLRYELKKKDLPSNDESQAG